MNDLQVIYDPQLEMAAIVDTTNRVGWGPAMVGPEAATLLQGWLDSTPWDMSELDTYSARSAYESFLDRVAGGQGETQATPGNDQVGEGTGDGVAEARLAEAEAAASGAEPPPPAPADADVEAYASPPPNVITCPNCNGEGQLTYGDDTESRTCPMCDGAKFVRMG